jgi:hypothetical protein
LNPGAPIPVVTKFLVHTVATVSISGLLVRLIEKQIPSQELDEPLLEAGLIP